MNMTDDEEFGAMMSLLGKEEAESLGLILAGIAACTTAIVYSCRHLKTSKCFGFSCQQEVVDVPKVVVCPDGRPPLESEV